MKTKILILVAVVIGALSFTGCKKYPDGPSFSFRSSDGRLEQTWKVTKLVAGGVDETAFVVAANYQIKFEKGGKATFSYTGGTDTQTWAWADSKKSLVMTGSGTGSVPETWVIQKLTKKDFVVKITDTTGGTTTVTDITMASV